MNFLLYFLKKLILLFFFDIDTDDIEKSEDSLLNQDEKNILKQKKTFSYLKFFISSITFISFLLLINSINNNNTDIDINQLQKLLDELATTVDWDLYRDIFLNIQKILSNNLNISEKNTIIYILNEIHSFFLLNTNSVLDPIKFNKIMKEIIKLLSKD